MPQFIEAVVEVLPSLPQECVQNRTQEQFADSPMPRNMEAVVEVGRITPQDRVQNRENLIVDLPMPLITEIMIWIATGARAKSRHVHWKSVYPASSSLYG